MNKMFSDRTAQCDWPGLLTPAAAGVGAIGLPGEERHGAIGELHKRVGDLRRSGFNPQKLPAVMFHRVGTMPNPILV